MLLNPVIISVTLLLVLSLCRINVVVALTLSALMAGLSSGHLSLDQTLKAFTGGLGNGAEIALGYAMLGAFAVAIARSGITEWGAAHIIGKLGATPSPRRQALVKSVLLLAILSMAVMSQNLIPIHIAFIPILIPPLLGVLTDLKVDRRLVACIMTFGLVTPYMVLPVGFGGIFLNKLVLTNLTNNGLVMDAATLPKAMLIPALGMVAGLLIAVFISYRKPRDYQPSHIEGDTPVHSKPNWRVLLVSALALGVAFWLQRSTDSVIFGALVGFCVFIVGGVVPWKQSQDAFTEGVRMMSLIGFIMITASGFAEVVKATGSVEILVKGLSQNMGSKPLAAALMLLIGLFVTMGIGSSFSTVPIIATLYVPLCISLGFSPLATAAIIGTAAALGDAGSPASDSTVGPTAGLNADGQHDHIRDSVLPTFLHYNLPLLVAGWVAAMVL
ncbi:Na+/H+ antiporter family protein [Gallaecimonas xiamenensis]|uniref:Gluconate:H+ symporter (GntP) family protein n=1 Tax=Gallaecimonas xiamenensis 3-C-1 TaxID=745411 RepID=K2IGE2_9GAMM|nr:Na+/H+ antiporter NhaC family protein [Gallaecimonas xiamenensis]EKE69136.1 gluconate:H+ symporter (GntP) family protein [Gallaecimonas xiamenensis 3-C-1]